MRTIGGDIVYSNPKVTNFVAQGEYYGAKASTLEYNGWDVLVGWAPPAGWKYFARYGQQNMYTPATNNPLSWDDRQLTLSIVQPISKTVWLQYEGEFNTAKTDTGAKPKDNLFFVELFTGF
jgi:hypothetical protein